MFDYSYLIDIDIAKEIKDINESGMAQLLGVPRSTLNNWRKNKNISRASLEKIYSLLFYEGIHINKMKEQMYCDMNTSDSIYLFHGAKKDFVEDITLSHSSDNNYFGKGLYLGDSFLQSASFVANYSDSSVYIMKLSNLKDLKIVQYDVSTEWMLTIAYYREKIKEFSNSTFLKGILKKMEGADIVIAPIADNRMFQILDEFIGGNITDLQCKSALSATNLGKQYVVISEKAKKHVEIIQHCYLCREEKYQYLKEKEESAKVSEQKVKYVKREFAGKGKYIEELLV